MRQHVHRRSVLLKMAMPRNGRAVCTLAIGDGGYRLFSPDEGKVRVLKLEQVVLQIHVRRTWILMVRGGFTLAVGVMVALRLVVGTLDLSGCLTPDKELSRLLVALGKDLQKQTLAELVGLVGSESAIWREAAQRELLRRGDKAAEAAAELEKVAFSNAGMPARVAAIFTLSATTGGCCCDAEASCDVGTGWLRLPCRHWWMTSDWQKDVPADVVVKCLADENPRVRLIAAWSSAH
ncbi:MAG: hypothetical protein U0894_19070 [Pirellulales bacterium]